MLMGGWISAAGADKKQIKLIPDYNATRTAYIIITVIAQVVSILLYLIFLFNLDKMPLLNRMNFTFLVS
jgi:hypothetical protein